MSLITELKRRNVFRVAAAYLVAGWLLTEVLTTILPKLGAPAWVADAVILMFAFGFIPAVVLSWIYEWTPDGIKREKDIEREDMLGNASVRKLDYVTIIGVVLIIVFISFFSASQAPNESDTSGATISQASVAVLPFLNLSTDKDNEYFSDGLTETLLHMLAQIPELKVAARTSSFAFKGKNMNIRDIADALQVAHILEGSVQKVGSRIRVTAQLIRAEDGYHVWSKEFNRDGDDIFGIQDEIAMTVGGSLSASLLGTGSEKPVAGVGTESTDAYDLYLQALTHRATFSYGGLEAAEKLLKGALTVDSNFIEAKTELAGNYLRQVQTGLMSEDEAFASVLAITDQVLAVEPENVNARAIRLFVEAKPKTTDSSPAAFSATVSALEAMVKTNPREYQARVLLSRILRSMGQLNKALQLQLEALQFDPYNARIHYEIGSLYLFLGQPNEARAALQRSLDIEPLQPNAYVHLGRAALILGDGVDYLQQNLKAMEIDSRDHEIPGYIAEFLYQLGLAEEADDFRDRVLAIAPTSAMAYRIELLRSISVGDEEASVAAARKAVEDNIEDRKLAYSGAVEHLLRTAARNGTVNAEVAYLERQAPGLLDVDATDVSTRFLAAQLRAFDAWFTTLSHEELLRRIERVQEIAASYGNDLLRDSGVRVDVMALQGNVSEAVDLALIDVFTKSVLMDQSWHIRYSQAQFADFVKDPGVQEAMQKWETEEMAVRDRVRTFLSDLSSLS